MRYLRRALAIFVCKLLVFASKLMGKKGSSTPGYVALLIDRTLLSYLSSQIKKKIIVVCGTNGKTTTNNLVYQLLTAKGYKVVCNNVGANMLPGVVCAFASRANIFGKLNADYAAIEIDEASTVHVFNHLKPHIMVITNLFRDQLDRYGEIDITMKKLKTALEKTKNTKLILNGDDPLTTSFYKGHESFFYGVEGKVLPSVSETKEGRFCVFCGEELSYNYYHYSQLGDYYCPGCGYKRPKLHFGAKDVDIKEGLSFTVGDMKIEVPYRGFYNVYNILAALCAIKTAGEDITDVVEPLCNYKPQIGRMESFVIGGKEVILNLSKNPAGFNQAISTTMADERPKDVMLAINDLEQDGTDISWLWDVDFERMNDKSIKSILVSGIRGEEMLLRLKYGGFNLSGVSLNKNLKEAVKTLICGNGRVVYLLVNYTVLFNMQNILKELEEESKN